MFEQMFELAVVVSAVDKLTGPLMKMVKSMGVAQKASAAMQKQIQQAKAMMMVGAGITGFGALLATGIIKAVDAAGKLQTSMMGVKEALKLTNGEFNTAMNLAQTVGIPTMFSSEDVGTMMQAMATSGLSKQQVLNPGILQNYVNFAEVQSRINHANAPDAVTSAVGMAHEYQLYSTQQIQPFLNQLNAALLHTSDTTSEFATTFKYIAGQAKLMGMGSSDTLATTAWLSRMGFGTGRGGTNFADFLRRSIYGSSGKAADSAMVQAGFVQNGRSIFENANGSFVGIPKAIKILQDFGDRFHHDAAQMSPLLNKIFGTQGARVAMMMTTQGASDQYVNVQKQIAGTASITQTQQQLNNTWEGKVMQFKTTLKDIQQSFGRVVLPDLLPLVKGLDDILGRVLKLEQQRPQMMKYIVMFTSLAAAAALVIGPMMAIAGLVKFMSAIGGLTGMVRLLGSAFLGLGRSIFNVTIRFAAIIMWRSTLIAIRIATLAWQAAQWLVNVAMDANPIGTVVMIIGLLIVAVVTIIAKWKEIVTWLKHVWEWFTHLKTSVQLLLALFVPFIGLPVLIISHWKPIETFFEGLGKTISGVVGGVEHFFGINTGGSGGGGSSYASIGGGSSSGGGDQTIHVHPGAIVVQASPGREQQAGNAVYQAITKQSVARSRASGLQTRTVY